MISQEQIQQLMGGKASVVDQNGERIGKLVEIYLDDSTNQPEWATVRTGLFGSSESFVPLRGARIIADELEVQYPKDIVKHAPRLDSGEHLAPAQEDELDRYYGAPTEAQSQPPEPGVQADEVDTIGIVRTDGGPAAPGRSRLRKYEVTEVRRETDDGGGRRV